MSVTCALAVCFAFWWVDEIPLSRYEPVTPFSGSTASATKPGKVVIGLAQPPRYKSWELDVKADSSGDALARDIEARLLEGLQQFRGDEAFRAETARGLIARPIFIAGDDVGLPVTPPPTGVSAFVDWGLRQVVIRWKLPEDGDYDRLVLCGWAMGAMELPKDCREYGWNIQSWSGVTMSTGLEPGQLTFTLMTVKGGVPSAPVTVFADGCRFIECTDPPFASGLHPNWHRMVVAGQTPIRATESKREIVPEILEVGEGIRIVNPNARPRPHKGKKLEWALDPESKERFQTLAQPAGVGAITRRVCVPSGSQLDIDMSFRIRGGEVPAGGDWGAFAWLGTDADLKGILASSSSGLATDERVVPLRAKGEARADGWQEFSTGGHGGPFTVPESNDEFQVVVYMRDTGAALLDADRLTVSRRDCTDGVPADYDPYGLYYIVDPKTGETRPGPKYVR